MKHIRNVGTRRNNKRGIDNDKNTQGGQVLTIIYQTSLFGYCLPLSPIPHQSFDKKKKLKGSTMHFVR